jgi:hypothetical protein
MLRAAMSGTISKVAVANEAARQLAQSTGQDLEKEASVDPSVPHYSTEYVQKLANAVGYTAEILKQADKGNVQMPGIGPGTLGVLEAESSEKNIDAGEGGQAIAANLPPKNPPTQQEPVQAGKAQTGLQSNDEMMHAEQPRDPWSNEKATLQNAASKQSDPSPAKPAPVKTAEALYLSNAARLGLIDEETKEAGIKEIAKRVGARGKELLKGTRLQQLKSIRAAGKKPGVVAAKSPKAEKRMLRQRFDMPVWKERAKVWGTRAAVGQVPLGAAGAAGYGMGKKSSAYFDKEAGLKDIASKATGYVKGLGGKYTQAFKGTRLKELKRQREYYGTQRLGGKKLKKDIWKERAKTWGARGAPAAALGAAGAGGYMAKKSSAPVDMIRKFAEDAVFPANIQSAHHEIPPAASASETGKVSVPKDVRAQQKMVGSNEAAINYTKGQAKADPKTDLNKVLDQPALSAAHDKILQKTLDHTSDAGVKISMAQNATRAAAARAVLAEMLDKTAAAKCKTKQSQGAGAPGSFVPINPPNAPTTPRGATGVPPITPPTV